MRRPANGRGYCRAVVLARDVQGGINRSEMHPMPAGRIVSPKDQGVVASHVGDAQPPTCEMTDPLAVWDFEANGREQNGRII
jgi:hypothetical protein